MSRAPGATTKRKPLTRLQRAKMLSDHGGLCWICKLPIDPAKSFMDEHIRPLGLGGSNDMSNRAPVHLHCGGLKTLVEDQPRIVKARAQQAAAVGKDPSVESKLKSRGFQKSSGKHSATTEIVKLAGLPRRGLYQ